MAQVGVVAVVMVMIVWWWVVPVPACPYFRRALASRGGVSQRRDPGRDSMSKVSLAYRYIGTVHT